ncbi:hypothetical protein C8R45DRAFT_926527 [Mycena sanguinolenta]|nr:hypothetical protein C8R45DRAFT_926526 [Mycena sanguinolenta]KAJ6495990.1 hypothetical protein C8R45DRAFT_926527 [Mycena sanguinolenta]
MDVSLCRCPDPSQCRCPKPNYHYYPLHPSPTPQFPHSVQMLTPSPLGPGGSTGTFGPGQYHQFMYHPMSGLDSPMSSVHSSPSPHAFYGHNSVPFPGTLTDITNGAHPPAQAGGKRKRVLGLSGSSCPGPPKRVTPRTSTTSNPSVSVSAAQSCGVGPSPQLDLPRTTPQTPGPYQDSSPFTLLQPPISFEPSTSTQQPDAEFTSKKKRSDSANKASDVYFFVQALTTDAAPDLLPQVSSGEGELTNPGLLTEKPSTEKFLYLGCRLCLNWKTWKNSAGGVTSTIWKHLQDKHGPIYYPTIKRLSLKHQEVREIWILAAIKKPFLFGSPLSLQCRDPGDLQSLEINV